MNQDILQLFQIACQDLDLFPLIEPKMIEKVWVEYGQVGTSRRSRCRCHAEEFYSLAAMGDRVEAWFEKILKNVTEASS